MPYRPVTIENQSLILRGEPSALYGGAVHYWRLDPDRWEEILDSVRGMGFTMISIYIPWEVHEIDKGRFDFGQVSPANDIDAFLGLCEAKGFTIVVRPGPQINSELTWFGYPKRILADERLHARGARGSRVVLTQAPKPIPALSYACDEFFGETGLWYDAICPILAKHAHPHGGIVAVQVDNEMAYFFSVNAYASDYSDASIDQYRASILDKYGDLEGVNSAYTTTFGGIEELDAPRRFECTAGRDIPWYADWAEYRERYLVTSMDRLARMMRERGLGGIALFHNYPHPLGPGGSGSGFTAPFNLVELEEKLDFVGFDIYSRKELYSHVKTISCYVAGTSRYPYIPEFIAGVWPWYLDPGDLADEEFVTKAALMHGIRGFSRYMLVERDRWLDSPIRRDGRHRGDKVAMYAKVNTMLESVDFQEFRRDADVLLLANREYDRLEAAAVLVSFPGDFLETPSGFSEYADPLTVSEDPLGFDQPVQLAKSTWFDAFSAALTKSGYTYLLSDTALRPARWLDHEVVVVATFEYLDSGLQSALVKYAEQGRSVVIGPRIPSLDSTMRPCAVIADVLAAAVPAVHGGRRARCGSGEIVLVADLDTAASEISDACGRAGLTKVLVDDPVVDVAVHSKRGDSGTKLVFVANPTHAPVTAEIWIGSRLTSVREIWDRRDVPTEAGSIVDDLEPYSVHVYRCAVGPRRRP